MDTIELPFSKLHTLEESFAPYSKRIYYWEWVFDEEKVLAEILFNHLKKKGIPIKGCFVTHLNKISSSVFYLESNIVDLDMKLGLEKTLHTITKLEQIENLEQLGFNFI